MNVRFRNNNDDSDGDDDVASLSLERAALSSKITKTFSMIMGCSIRSRIHKGLTKSIIKSCWLPRIEILGARLIH